MPKACPVCGGILFEEDGFLRCGNCSFKIRHFSYLEINKIYLEKEVDYYGDDDKRSVE